MSRPGIRPGMAALAVAAGVAVVAMAASLLGPAVEVDEEYPAQFQPVVRSTFVCPYAGGEDGDVDARVGVLALDGVTGEDGDEAEPITATPLETRDANIDLEEESEGDDSGDGDDESTASPESTESAEPEEAPEPILTQPDRGDPNVEPVDVGEPTSFAVDVRGPLAAGVAAETRTLARDSQLHGYSTAACTAPEREHWFVGGSAKEGRRGTLVLSNPSNVSAVVDVDLWTGSGPIDAAATQDISVPPDSQRLLLLDALAAGAAQVAVHVSAERGKVSAAIEMRERGDGGPRGVSYVPRASEPANEFVIPGVSGAGRPTLQLFAPGDVDAIVSLSYLGENGQFTPAGQDVVTVPAGGVLTVPLEDVQAPIAVAVSSDEPVTAAVRIARNSDDGPRDIAFTAATAPLEGPAAALLGRATSNFTTSLLISSISEVSSRADVQLLDNDGNVVDERTVDVAAHSTVAIDLEHFEGASYPYAVLRPADPGALVVARQVRASADDGAYIDIMPMNTLGIEVQVPEVVNELPEIPDPEEEAETS